VTAGMLDAVQVLMDATCVREFIGHGRGRSVTTHSSMRVVSDSRVENHTLWRRYAMQCRGHLRPADSAVQDDTWQHLPGELEKSLDRGRNKCFLFHGPKPELAAVISAQGFEERVANDHGLLGAGVYFAENSSKSDDYVQPDEKGYCNLFLTRVCLGSPFISNNRLSGLHRPPCVEACESGSACGHVRFDSVIGEKRSNDRRACLERYREFIVFDRIQCYPEFLIRYMRESAGERSAREKRKAEARRQVELKQKRLREEREAHKRERKERGEAEERKRAEEQMAKEKKKKEEAALLEKRAKAKALVQERRAIQERAEEQLARAQERRRVCLESQSTEGRFVPLDSSNWESSLRLDAPSFEPSWIASRANRGYSTESVSSRTASGNSQLKVSAASFEARTTTNLYS
jgi:hypothetical protein